MRISTSISADTPGARWSILEYVYCVTYTVSNLLELTNLSIDSPKAVHTCTAAISLIVDECKTVAPT